MRAVRGTVTSPGARGSGPGLGIGEDMPREGMIACHLGDWAEAGVGRRIRAPSKGCFDVIKRKEVLT